MTNSRIYKVDSSPAPTNEPTTAHHTPPDPDAESLAACADLKKARAKKAAMKEPISYMLLTRVACGDRNIEESSIGGAI